MDMDLNIVVLCGRIAAEPEIRRFPSGSTLIRFLVTTRSTTPRRRVDVIPVTLWEPHEELLSATDLAGRGLWVCGAVQRRFWSADGGRASRIEIVAHVVEVRDEEAGEHGTAPA